MAPVEETSQSVVRFSSQDPIHRAENILVKNKKWLSHKTDRSGRIEVEIHLPKAMRIAFVNIGNAGSAFIELLVGRSMWPAGTNYIPFLPSTVLMLPQDSKTGKNTECVKMLSKDVFCNDASDQEWDRVQVICCQPFNKEKQFGLQFVHFVEGSKPKTPDSLNRSPQQTFAQFKSMLSPTTKRNNLINKSPSGSRLSTPSRAASLVQAALKSKDKQKHILTETTPTRQRVAPNRPKTRPYQVKRSPSEQRGKTASRSSAGDIEDEVECFLEGCKFEDMPLPVLQGLTYRDLKEKMEQQRGCPLTKPERKIFLKLTAKVIENVSKNVDFENIEKLEEKTSGEPCAKQYVEVIDLSMEDLCSSECSQLKPVNSIDDESTHISSHVGTGGNDDDISPSVSCPICHELFPQSNIAVHASVCAEITFGTPSEMCL